MYFLFVIFAVVVVVITTITTITKNNIDINKEIHILSFFFSSFSSLLLLLQCHAFAKRVSGALGVGGGGSVGGDSWQ